MSNEVKGVKLSNFEEPIRYALQTYSEIALGKVAFDIDTASKLELTPDKPNSARSISNVIHLGEVATKLYIIAFAPDDGTGDYSTYTAEQLDVGPFPPPAKYFPRSKASIDTEAHLTIASKLIDSDYDPVLFTGHLSVFGLVKNRITNIGYLGQSERFFDYSLEHNREIPPIATLTTGYRYGLEDSDIDDFRFGDPHAVVNESERSVQVCGFIGITPEQAKQHREMFQLFEPSEL